MFDHRVSQRNQTQVLAAQVYLDQARQQRTEQCLEAAYFENGELLEKLEKSDKVPASHNKARTWDYEGTQLASNASTAPLPPCKIPAVAQTAPPAFHSAQKKSALVDYLFEKALSTLSSLEVSNKPSLFLVYAHNNPAHGQAEAETSRYLIEKLSAIRVNLYSDQTPMGQLYSGSPEDLNERGKLDDILTSQLCLLPARLRKGVEPVDKVVVCCSRVLESYLKWQYYKRFLSGPSGRLSPGPRKRGYFDHS